ncbi:MAG: GrpB family protein [Acidimicrobiales bacterium]
MGAARVVIVEYRSDWPGRAAELILALEEALAGHLDRIDHIGSTAIPGMAAKDLLDLQVGVSDLADADARFDLLLAALGFRRSEYESDHVPAGRADDPENWSKWLYQRQGHPQGDVNLHVRRTGAPNHRLALLFRDWFRAHPAAVPAYSAFKVVLARTVPDLGGYTETKDPVVDLVIAAAEEWAERTSWVP